VRGLLKVLILLCTLGGPLTASGAPDDASTLQQQAREQLDAGEAAQAYAALKARDEFTGEGWYELLLGEAALASGHGDEAIARLEPYVAANPQQDEPQLLLARSPWPCCS
jgi:predicted Zn-dependent protease